MITLTPPEESLRAFLINLARTTGRPMRYGAMAEATDPEHDPNDRHHRRLQKRLFHVNTYELEHGRPMIGAFAVNSTGAAGGGLAKMARPHGIHVPEGGESQFASDQVDASIAYWTTHDEDPQTDAQLALILGKLSSIERMVRTQVYSEPDRPRLARKTAEYEASKKPTVHVLQVDSDPANLDELGDGLKKNHTVDDWQMPKTAKPGDVAVWYATIPTGAYVAWGWIEDVPHKVDEGHGPFRGPVKGMRSLQPPVSRDDVIRACDIDGGVQSYQTVKDRAPAFLEAIGLGLIAEVHSEVVTALG
jgi:hypothetical protein